jgi:DHA3 family macrolide efflux protein-like MFS transporter
VVEFALAWYLTKSTGSATVLSTALMVALLPQIILGPFIGPLVDRWDRKKIMIFSDLAITLMTVALVVLFLTGKAEIWHIYVAMVGRAVGQAFQYPAMQEAVANIVPEKHLSRAGGAEPDA